MECQYIFSTFTKNFFFKYIFNFKNHKLIGKKPNNKFENFIKK